MQMNNMESPKAAREQKAKGKRSPPKQTRNTDIKESLKADTGKGQQPEKRKEEEKGLLQDPLFQVYGEILPRSN